MTLPTPDASLAEDERQLDPAQTEPLIGPNVDNAEITQPADGDADDEAASELPADL